MRLMRGTWVAFAASVLLLTGCAHRVLSPQQFVAESRLIDDPMNTAVLLVSPLLRQPAPHSDVLRIDVRLVAAWDRKSSLVRYSVEQQVEHRLGRWLMPRSARYLTSQGEIVPARWFDRDRGDVWCGSIGSCQYTEVSRLGLRHEDVSAIGPSAPPLRLRVQSDGVDIDSVIDQDAVRAFYEAAEVRAKTMFVSSLR
jgi:hypothetical protein